MSSITSPHQVTQVTPEEMPKFLEMLGDNIKSTVNGGLDFKTNFNGKTVPVVFSSANTNTVITHGLGRIPVGYIKVSQSAGMNIFDGTIPATTTFIYLQSSAVGTASLLIY